MNGKIPEGPPDIFSSHMEGVAPPPAEPADKVELWAKRTGRIIGLILLVVLAVNLATGWIF